MAEIRVGCGVDLGKGEFRGAGAVPPKPEVEVAMAAVGAHLSGLSGAGRDGLPLPGWSAGWRCLGPDIESPARPPAAPSV
jgi:hypothetical protein